MQARTGLASVHHASLAVQDSWTNSSTEWGRGGVPGLPPIPQDAHFTSRVWPSSAGGTPPARSGPPLPRPIDHQDTMVVATSASMHPRALVPRGHEVL